MDVEDELLEMADVTSHSDISEESKREVSPKLIEGNCMMLLFTLRSSCPKLHCYSHTWACYYMTPYM